jgi:type I restriction enzyme M protein
LPEGQNKYTKTRPMQFEEFAPLIEWWDAPRREENEHAWKVRVDDVLKYDENKNLLSVNLDVKNPTRKDDLEHLPPQELAENIIAKEKQIVELMNEIKSLLS